MTAHGMEEGERMGTEQDVLVGVEGSSDPDRQEPMEAPVLSESKRDSLRNQKVDSFKDPKRDSLRDQKRDSLLRDIKRDSLRDARRDSLRDTKRDSLVEKRDSLSGRDSPRPRTDSEARRQAIQRDSQRKSRGSGDGKTAAERKRASGRSLDKNYEKKGKMEDDEKKSDGDMVETASVIAKRKALLLERRLLCGCTGLVGLAALIWLLAVCTESWFTVYAPSPGGIYINATERYFLYSTSGLFRICRYARRNESSKIHQMCQLHEMFPTEERLKAAIWVDKTIINYTRTEMFFSIVSLIFMIMGFLFSIYTFRNPRYMFKRLAAGIHFLSGATVMVVIEVLINSIDYERISLNVVHPKDAHYTFGYSFYLGWSVFLLNCMSSITFLIYSKKRKGDKAPNEEIAMADEPTIIGR